MTLTLNFAMLFKMAQTAVRISIFTVSLDFYGDNALIKVILDLKMIIRGAIKGFKSMVSSLVTNPGFGFASPRVCHQELTHALKPYIIAPVSLC